MCGPIDGRPVRFPTQRHINKYAPRPLLGEAHQQRLHHPHHAAQPPLGHAAPTSTTVPIAVPVALHLIFYCYFWLKVCERACGLCCSNIRTQYASSTRTTYPERQAEAVEQRRKVLLEERTPAQNDVVLGQEHHRLWIYNSSLCRVMVRLLRL